MTILLPAIRRDCCRVRVFAGRRSTILGPEERYRMATPLFPWISALMQQGHSPVSEPKPAPVQLTGGWCLRPGLAASGTTNGETVCGFRDRVRWRGNCLMARYCPTGAAASRILPESG